MQRADRGDAISAERPTDAGTTTEVDDPPGDDGLEARVRARASDAGRRVRDAARHAAAGLRQRVVEARDRVVAGPEPSGRLLSLDVFRGVLIAAVVVLDPLSGSRDHPHLAHATWDGYTVTDLVFPSLLVVSGVGLAFLLRGPVDRAAVRRIARRTIALLLLGVVVYNQLGDLDLSGARLTGVLQMFAVSGLLAWLVVALLRVVGRGDRWWLGAVAVAAGTWAYQARFLAARARTACAHPEGWCSPFHAVDVRWLGEEHLYRGGASAWDPEGLVPSIAATLLVLAGWTVGVAVRDRRRDDADTRPWLLPVGLVAAGAVLLGVVTPWLAGDLEVNKRLHTPAFQTLTVGYDLLVIAGLYVVFDARVPRRAGAAIGWARRAIAWPLETLGRNPLTVYVLAHVTLTALVRTEHPTAGTWQAWFRSWTVDVAGGPLWGDPVFNEVFGLLALMFAVAVVMRLLDWRVSL